MRTMLSDRVRRMIPSATMEISARVAELRDEGVKVISFSVGEPDFPTPSNIIAACERAMRDGHTKYVPVQGIAELRRAISGKLERDNGVRYQPSEIVVSTGAKQALNNAALALISPGDEVIIPTPCWVSYIEIVKLADGVPVFVENSESDRFALSLDAIEQAITPRTRAIMFNTPHNPTGAVYSEESLRKLADIAVKHGIYLIADEVYEKLIYGRKKHFCVASISEKVRDLTIVVNGLSKACSMTGWRMGYTAANEEITRAIISIQGHMTSNATTFVQYAAIEGLANCEDAIEEMRCEFERRRDFLISGLRSIPGVTCEDADGAFYLLPNISSYYGSSDGDRVIDDSIDLCRYLLDRAHVAVVPGEAFLAPDNIRISYSNSMENLAKGLEKIKAALARLS